MLQLCTLHHTVPAAVALLTLLAILEPVGSQSFASGKVQILQFGVTGFSLPTGPPLAISDHATTLSLMFAVLQDRLI